MEVTEGSGLTMNTPVATTVVAVVAYTLQLAAQARTTLVARKPMAQMLAVAPAVLRSTITWIQVFLFYLGWVKTPMGIS